MQIDIYDSRPVGTEQPVVSLNDLADAVDMALPKGTNSSNSSMMGLAVMKESMYNTYLDFRGMDRVDLGEDGYLITSDMGESVNKIYNAVMDKDVEIEFGGRTLHPASDHVNDGSEFVLQLAHGSNAGTIVVPDELVDAQAALCTRAI